MSDRRSVIVKVLVMALALSGLSACRFASTRQTTISVDTQIDGVPCRAGEVMYHPDGRLQHCFLSKVGTVRGAALPAGANVWFKEDGTYERVFLPNGVSMIEGHQCLGDGSDGWETLFHPDGRLRICWLAHEEVIDGVPCDSASILKETRYRNSGSAHFNSDGSLESCRAARDVAIGGHQYRAYERVTVTRGVSNR